MQLKCMKVASLKIVVEHKYLPRQKIIPEALCELTNFNILYRISNKFHQPLMTPPLQTIIFHLSRNPLIRFYFVKLHSPPRVPLPEWTRLRNTRGFVKRRRRSDYRNYVHPRYPRSANDTDPVRGCVGIGLATL